MLGFLGIMFDLDLVMFLERDKQLAILRLTRK